MGALTGTLVMDFSRMLPGAVLARVLLELGARVIRVEHPDGGDPMRALQPLDARGVGAGFAAFLAGAESVALDLSHQPAAAAARRLAARADVLVESFRPGTLARWGLAPPMLQLDNPRLVVCSLSSFGCEAPWRYALGHDLNFAALSGLLTLLAGGGRPRVPRAQLVDVTAGLLAAGSILATLLERERTGRGRHLEQPLATGALPFLTWPWADRWNGGEHARPESDATRLLTGRVPAYRLYPCADGRWVALAAIESSLWRRFLDAIGLPALAAAGLDPGRAGSNAAARVRARLRERPRAEWLALARERGIPLTAVEPPEQSMRRGYYAARASGESGGPAAAAGLAAAAGRGRAPAPLLGEHTEAVLREIGLTPVEIAATRAR